MRTVEQAEHQRFGTKARRAGDGGRKAGSHCGRHCCKASAGAHPRCEGKHWACRLLPVRRRRPSPPLPPAVLPPGAPALASACPTPGTPLQTGPRRSCAPPASAGPCRCPPSRPFAAPASWARPWPPCSRASAIADCGDAQGAAEGGATNCMSRQHAWHRLWPPGACTRSLCTLLQHLVFHLAALSPCGLPSANLALGSTLLLPLRASQPHSQHATMIVSVYSAQQGRWKPQCLPPPAACRRRVTRAAACLNSPSLAPNSALQICLGPVCVPLHLLLPFLVAMVSARQARSLGYGLVPAGAPAFHLRHSPTCRPTTTAGCSGSSASGSRSPGGTASCASAAAAAAPQSRPTAEPRPRLPRSPRAARRRRRMAAAMVAAAAGWQRMRRQRWQPALPAALAHAARRESSVFTATVPCANLPLRIKRRLYKGWREV